MPLSARSRFELINWLAERYDAVKAPSVLTNATLPTTSYSFSQAPLNFWTSIVVDLDTRGTLLNLLDHILNYDYRNDQFIRQIRDELKNSYSTKLEFLAKAISAGQCILFLGPSVLLCDQNNTLKPFNKILAQQLVNALNSNNIYYDPGQAENLNYIAQRFTEISTYISGEQGRVALKTYLDQRNDGALDTSIYSLLAELPFRIIINTNPDEELANIINDKFSNDLTPYPCETRYYDPGRTKPDDDPPLNPNTVLQYNILGSFKNPLSILMSESQLLNFTRRIIEGTPALDKQVRLEFNEHKYYLFLGFDFDQWYLKIIFEMVLRLVKQKGRAFSISSNNTSYSAFNREFFEEEFKFYFIEEDAKRFVVKLRNAFKLLSPVQP